MSNNEFLENWAYYFKLLCVPKWKVGIIGSAYFCGLICGLPFIAPYADFYGQKGMFLS